MTGGAGAAEDWELVRDKQQCTELVYQLARGLDRCDPDLLRAVFHEDATDDHGWFKGSAADFIDWALGVLAKMERTQHAISNVIVEVQGNEARSESYFVANHDLHADDGSPARMIAAGRYLDRFERRGGVWKIAHRQAVYDWNAWEPRTDRWDRSAEGPREYGRRGDRKDPVYAFMYSLRAEAPAAVAGEAA